MGTAGGTRDAQACQWTYDRLAPRPEGGVHRPGGSRRDGARGRAREAPPSTSFRASHHQPRSSHPPRDSRPTHPQGRDLLGGACCTLLEDSDPGDLRMWERYRYPVPLDVRHSFSPVGAGIHRVRLVVTDAAARELARHWLMRAKDWETWRKHRSSPLSPCQWCGRGNGTWGAQGTGTPQGTGG